MAQRRAADGFKHHRAAGCLPPAVSSDDRPWRLAAPKELFRSADAAQYAAKRAGRGRVRVSRPAADTHIEGVRAPWRFFRDRTDGMHGLLDSSLALLDGPLAAADEKRIRLEAVAATAAAALDVVSWTISVSDGLGSGGSGEVRAVLVGMARVDGTGGSERVGHVRRCGELRRR